MTAIAEEEGASFFPTTAGLTEDDFDRLAKIRGYKVNL